MQPKNSSELFIFAQQLADAAGGVLRRHFNTGLDVEQKADASPVTLADREVEKTLRAMIEARYPQHGIVGEEFGNVRADAELQWVLDPIDGTKAFIAGALTFTTLIALCENGVPVLGVIDQPILQERFSGIRGEEKKSLNNVKKISAANISTTSTDYFTAAQKNAFAKLQAATANISLGGDAYAYAMLPTGKLDIVVDAGMKPYDFCALAPVIESAGGTITDWAGKPLTLTSDGTVLAAASADLHVAALELLNK